MAEVRVASEIGALQKVILHRPGAEIEIMTPESAFELLYDDILYLQDAEKQHRELEQILQLFARTYLVKDLLRDILEDDSTRKGLITDLTRAADCPESSQILMELSPEELTSQLFTGTPLKKDSLTKYFSDRNYALPPLPNFFYMRDSSMVVNGHVVLGSMANSIRKAESIIMNWIFRKHPEFDPKGFFLDASEDRNPGATFEGGDVLVIRKDTVMIGMGERTTPQGVDYLISRFAEDPEIKHVIAVKMPKERATIHLDMIFTMIDHNLCVVYPPLILKDSALNVYHIHLKSEKNTVIEERRNIFVALKDIGIDLHPVNCGGDDPLEQAREQWQSGANFFTIAPGKIIGYDRNPGTLKALNKAGLPTVMAKDVINGDVDLHNMERFVVAISSSELVRGGGGCRCMTMPVFREELDL